MFRRLDTWHPIRREGRFWYPLGMLAVQGPGTRPGPYWGHWGPTDGPLRFRDSGPALGVLDNLHSPPMPIGIAFCVGYVADWRGPVATFRLTIGKDILPGLYVLDRRRFVPAEEWEERAAIREFG